MDDAPARPPDDFVIATGEMHTVREFVDLAFALVGRDWRDYVEMDERYLRPTEVDELQGDASKARDSLGWQREDAVPRSRPPDARVFDLREAGVDPDLPLLGCKPIEPIGAAR